MLTEERYQQILALLDEKHSVSVTELVETIGTSESTIRRDLTSLAKMGKLKKVHGGAVSLYQEIMSNEPNVEEKMKLNADEKELIAKYAAATIRKNDFVFIDAGTTTEKMIPHITEKEATFVTNGFNHAHLLARNGFKVYLTGGEVKPTTEAIVGASCVETLSKYNFTKCFLGVNGISVENGLTTPNVDEASVKRAVPEKSYVTYILADHTKFDKTAAVTFSNIEKACIITDRLPNKKYKDLTIIKEVCE